MVMFLKWSFQILDYSFIRTFHLPVYTTFPLLQYVKSHQTFCYCLLSKLVGVPVADENYQFPVVLKRG